MDSVAEAFAPKHAGSMWRPIIILGLGAVYAFGADRLTTLHFDLQSVGTIVGTNGQISGTGFVVGTPDHIITCEHVAAMQPVFNYHFLNGLQAHVPVTLETVLRRYDVAVLRIDSTNRLPPLPYGDIRRVRPGDDVVYVGWNVNDGKFRISKAEVTAIGVAFNEGVSVDFIEFEGEGIPGYSGGPILNVKGEVVALMREAWNKRGLKGGPEVLVNRGFSIEPAMLSKEIFYPTGPAFTNAPGTNTISIRLESR